MSTPHAWERAQRIAAAALRGNVYRPVGLALNYHTTAISPYWAPSLIPQTVVGAHIFYRRPGSESVQAFSQAYSADEAGRWLVPELRGAPQRAAAGRAPALWPAGSAHRNADASTAPQIERPVTYRTAAARRPRPPRRRAQPAEPGPGAADPPRHPHHVSRAAFASPRRLVTP